MVVDEHYALNPGRRRSEKAGLRKGKMRVSVHMQIAHMSPTRADTRAWEGVQTPQGQVNILWSHFYQSYHHCVANFQTMDKEAYKRNQAKLP